MSTRAGTNIWQAASNGDLTLVQQLVNQGGVSPDAEDGNQYTPLAAAASWSHAEVARWLVNEAGADVNKKDTDGESALFLVESVDMAKLLVEELKADYLLENHEGRTAAEAVEDPEIADYLSALPGMESSRPTMAGLRQQRQQQQEPLQPAVSFSPSLEGGGVLLDQDGNPYTNHPNAEASAEVRTRDLLAQARELLNKPEEAGVNKDEELRRLVTDAVFQSYSEGQAQSESNGSVADSSKVQKRHRGDDGPER